MSEEEKLDAIVVWHTQLVPLDGDAMTMAFLGGVENGAHSSISFSSIVVGR